jgi:hypothetical protein
MNERIRELADQILPNEKEYNKGDPKDWGYFFSGEELNSFAELIVRECADVAVNHHLYGPPETSADTAIKTHFGVSE